MEPFGFVVLLGFSGHNFTTWTPKVCRILAFYRFRAMILHTFGGLGGCSACTFLELRGSNSSARHSKIPSSRAICWGLCFRVSGFRPCLGPKASTGSQIKTYSRSGALIIEQGLEVYTNGCIQGLPNLKPQTLLL